MRCGRVLSPREFCFHLQFLLPYCRISQRGDYFLLLLLEMFTNLTSGALFYASGKVVHGFGRGSKQLGIPTANLEESVVDQLPATIENGIYFGWAKLSNTPVYKMVMSIGWNPYFKNVKRSMEVHILNTFEDSFYGETIKLISVKYFRPELDFPSIELDA
uniref:riboflavin kinase n=1 Tax=Trichobilharzia regenti TaxID=157069 RepID=A0AA85IT00_TRIRE|nr:unnamed protein product [Trichobilharzia regenti]